MPHPRMPKTFLHIAKTPMLQINNALAWTALEMDIYHRCSGPDNAGISPEIDDSVRI
jgi:hypothetical protein